jgi:hypothetical protein
VEQFANLAETTLAAGYTAAAGTIDVASAAGFPATGTFRVRLGNVEETLLIVTAVAGTTWTVTPEANDADAASADTVTLVLTAGAMAAFRVDTTGYTPPVDADFSWVNQSLATTDGAHGFIHLVVPDETSSHNVRARVKAAPTAPYSVTAALRFRRDNPGGTNWVGLCFRESATGKLVQLAQFRDKSLVVNNYTSPTAFSSQPAVVSPYDMPQVVWFRLTDNGTTLTYAYSPSGFYFKSVYSSARAAFFTTAPDEIGFFCNSLDNAGGEVDVDVLSWLQE